MSRRIPTMLPKTLRKASIALLLLAVGAAAGYFTKQPERVAGQADEPGAEAVLSAYAARRSDQWLEASGLVARTLPDDQEG